VKAVVRRLRERAPRQQRGGCDGTEHRASANLGGKIDLGEAARQLPKSMYEPAQFPGIIHRMADPKTVILLFSSGKLVCTGAKRETEVYRAWTTCTRRSSRRGS